MLKNETHLKDEINCCKSIIRREYSNKFTYKYSLKAIKSLILQEHYQYKKVWEKTSTKNITSEQGRIYFDNYTDVYGGYGKRNQPKHLYKLESQKIENALTCRARTEEIGSYIQPNKRFESLSFFSEIQYHIFTVFRGDCDHDCMIESGLPYDGERDCMICVTKNNTRLIRVHLTSGKILQDIFLSPVYSFRDISWNETETSIVVRSTKPKRQTNVIKALAVFDVKPLQFVGMVEITKQVFDNKTLDAGLCQGVLITMHQQCKVKMYSFQHILEMYRTGTYKLDDIIDDEGNRLGHQPVGLKFNIKITECPPILFEVSCFDHIVEFSYKSFHYLFSPVNLPEYFEVHSLERQSMIKNGKLHTGVLNFVSDRYRASFWDDESGRIMHIATSVVSFYDLAALPEQDNGERMLQQCFEINMLKDKSKDEIPFTSSGRKVNRPDRKDSIDTEDNITIYNVDYEDELNIICVTAVYHDHDTPRGVVCFYDNKTGRHLKEVNIEEPCSEINEHRTYIDLDTIIQINKLWSGKYHCTVYRLTSTMSEDQEVKTKMHRKTTRRTSHHRTRTRSAN